MTIHGIKSRPGQTSRLVAEWKSKLLHLGGFPNIEGGKIAESTFHWFQGLLWVIWVMENGLFSELQIEKKPNGFQGEGRMCFLTSMGLPNISYWKFHQHLGLDKRSAGFWRFHASQAMIVGANWWWLKRMSFFLKFRKAVFVSVLCVDESYMTWKGIITMDHENDPVNHPVWILKDSFTWCNCIH